MSDREKMVMRLNDGSLLKGYLKDFAPTQADVIVEEAEGAKTRPVRIEEVKAVFFVRSFEGDNTYREKKAYGISKPKGQKVLIKFRDNEFLVGFLDGDVPWDKGFFLSRQDRGVKGFYILPVDEDANNIRVFVVTSSVIDVTVVP